MERPERALAGLGVPLLFCALALLFAALAERPLNGDAAIWCLTMMKSGFFFWFLPLQRYFDPILQIPSLSIIHLSGSADWGSAAVWAWNFMYVLYPLPSLWLSWKICKKAGREDLFLFSALGFAVGILTSLGNSVSVVGIGLAVFWPLLTYFLVSKPSAKALAWIAAGSLCMALTHETALFGFLVLAAFAFQRAGQRDDGRRLSHRYYLACGAGFLIVAAWLAYRAKIGFAYATQFNDSISSYPWGPFTWASLVAAGAFGLALLTRRSSILPLGALTALACYLAISFKRPDFFGDLYCSMNSRVMSFAAGAAIGAAACWAFSRPWWTKAEGQTLRVSLTRFVACILALGAFNETVTTLRWSNGLILLKQELASLPDGCSFISQQLFENYLGPAGIQSWNVSDLSLVLQRTRNPTKILSLRSLMEDEVKTNFCHDVARGGFQRYGGENYRLNDTRYMNFSRLRAAATSP